MKEREKIKAVSLETYITIIVILSIFIYMGRIMGVGNMFNTMMKTAHDLLINTVFFIMAIAIMTGALASVMSEFGVIALLNYLISPIMKPIYGLPGAASLGIITTFFSDNPAIIGLTNDEGFSKYFKNYQLPTLCNLGTSFGMGLIVWTFMGSLGDGTTYMKAATIGVFSAFLGSIVSVRIMMHFTKKYYQVSTEYLKEKNLSTSNLKDAPEGTIMERILDSLLEGGKNGVQCGFDIIPGVVVICTFIMMLTFKAPVDPATGQVVYSGAAYEGVALIPKLGQLLSPILTPLFGFSSPDAIAFPITALGSAGAAIGMVPKMLSAKLISANDIAVFTALGMCWSGYLSTHVGMMDALGVRSLSTKAILSHTIGGICAGIAAHFIFILIG